ncbi:hypothetical protein StoSoilA2_19640 [Arthrobacter sp. StoSoilA2]|nr:hypothetical protein StoSoilA2_19640 [Arthrobacter sp. StoSoilA2]
MGDLSRDSQGFAGLCLCLAGLTSGFHNAPAPARELLGFRVRRHSFPCCGFRSLREKLAGSAHLVAARRGDFAQGIAAVNVFPHLEQLMDRRLGLAHEEITIAGVSGRTPSSPRHGRVPLPRVVPLQNA